MEWGFRREPSGSTVPARYRPGKNSNRGNASSQNANQKKAFRNRTLLATQMAAAGMGLPQFLAKPAARGINRIGHALGIGKRRKRSNNGRGATTMSYNSAQVPAAVQKVVIGNNQKVIPFPSSYQIKTGLNGNTGVFTFPLAPWGTSTSTSSADPKIAWDPKLLSEYPKYTEYRVKSAKISYTGTAPTGTSGTAYIGSSRSPLTPTPELHDFSALERFSKFSLWEACEFPVVADSDWHEIQPGATLQNPDLSSSAMVLYFPNLTFIGWHIPTLSGVEFTIQLTIEYEFRGDRKSVV